MLAFPAFAVSVPPPDPNSVDPPVRSPVLFMMLALAAVLELRNLRLAPPRLSTVLIVEFPAELKFLNVTLLAASIEKVGLTAELLTMPAPWILRVCPQRLPEH